MSELAIFLFVAVILWLHYLTMGGPVAVKILPQASRAAEEIRIGDSPGQLSLAGAEAGQLSLAQAEAGRLSLADDPAGQLSLPPEERSPWPK